MYIENDTTAAFSTSQDRRATGTAPAAMIITQIRTRERTLKAPNTWTMAKAAPAARPQAPASRAGMNTRSANQEGKAQVAAEQGGDRPARRVPALSSGDSVGLDQEELRRQLTEIEPLGMAGHEAERAGGEDEGDQPPQHHQMRRADPHRPLAEERQPAHFSGQQPPAIDASEDIARIDQEEIGEQIATLEHRMQTGQRDGGRQLIVMDDDSAGDDEAYGVQPSAPDDGMCLASNRNAKPGQRQRLRQAPGETPLQLSCLNPPRSPESPCCNPPSRSSPGDRASRPRRRRAVWTRTQLWKAPPTRSSRRTRTRVSGGSMPIRSRPPRPPLCGPRSKAPGACGSRSRIWPTPTGWPWPFRACPRFGPAAFSCTGSTTAVARRPERSSCASRPGPPSAPAT